MVQEDMESSFKLGKELSDSSLIININYNKTWNITKSLKV